MIRIPRNLLASFILVSLATGAYSDGLWERTLSIAQANRDWLARSIQVDAKQLNREGDVVDQGSLVVTRSVTGAGTLTDSIQQGGTAPPDADSIFSGGLGVPAALRSGPGNLSLFDPRRQNELDLTRAHGTEWLPGGREAAIFVYSQDTGSDGTVRGRVWVDVNTGVTLRLETTPEKTAAPLISNTSLVYFNADPSRWYPTRVETVGVARRLMIQRTIEMTMILGDYTWYPGSENKD
jgi:hypothetical protein